MKNKDKIMKEIIGHYHLNFKLGILYMNLSNKMYNFGMFNFAKYLRELANDKLITHKDILFEYVNKCNYNIDAPINDLEYKCDSDEPKKIVETVYKLEMMVRDAIESMSKNALNYEDFETFHFLTWFVNDGVKDFVDIEKITKWFQMSNDYMAIDAAIGELLKSE